MAGGGKKMRNLRKPKITGLKLKRRLSISYSLNRKKQGLSLFASDSAAQELSSRADVDGLADSLYSLVQTAVQINSPYQNEFHDFLAKFTPEMHRERLAELVFGEEEEEEEEEDDFEPLLQPLDMPAHNGKEVINAGSSKD